MTTVIYSEVQPTTINNSEKNSNTFKIEVAQTPPTNQVELTPNSPALPGIYNTCNNGM